DRPLGRRVLASGEAADPGDRGLLLHHHLHDGRLRRRGSRPWLARAGRDRGPHGPHPGRLVDGVRIRGRRPHVRALAAGARAVLRALPRARAWRSPARDRSATWDAPATPTGRLVSAGACTRAWEESRGGTLTRPS